MIKLEQPVIVEGKYDKITLENVVDALIIPTEGFGIFKNKEKREMIRFLARKSGIIVITDSDSAGHLIRAHIKNIVSDGQITNVYIPCLKGKESRKQKAAKEGLLGLEGMTVDAIEQALIRSGITGKRVEKRTRTITKTDMFEAGLSGGDNSREKRKKLLEKLGLPEGLSPNAMLDILNTMLTFDEFKEVTGWQGNQTKS